MERKSGYCCDQERNAIILLKLKDGKTARKNKKKNMGNSFAPGNSGLCVKQQFGMKFNLPPPPFLWLLAVYVYVARTVSTHFPRKACKNVREKGNFQFPVVKNRPLSAKHCFGGN